MSCPDDRREESMAQTPPSEERSATAENVNRARDHLANERTFLAWLRTGLAIVVFGFAIGRFAIAVRQFMRFQGRAIEGGGFSVWFGTAAMVAGVVLTLAGLQRYRRTRAMLESGSFEPAGFVVDLVGILTAIFGLALAGYLVYIELRL
jgi:putative membrane protein